MTIETVAKYASEMPGFSKSPEYLNFKNTFDTKAPDPGTYDSDYFGPLDGMVYGQALDYAFEGYLLRTTGKNPGAAVTTAGGVNPSSLSAIHIALIAAAAFYFLR
ncbi:MAG: hypothetical protein EBU96_09410 [Actinobacteria bacterium]|nr:hypothetical protein [Actinomycetota bacterium]